MRRIAFFLALTTLGFLVEGQEDIQLMEVEITRERSLMQPKSLYGAADDIPPHIGNVFQLDIFQDQIDQQVWYTPTVCLEVEQQTEIAPGGETGMKLKWNKLREGCGTDWIGLGIGWDGWAAKDLFGIMDSAAIRFRVRAEDGEIKGLPLAVCLEDYTDKQAWLGMSPDRFEDGPIGTEWSDIVLPLNAFSWNENNANPSNIKQMIIQFEAEGSLIIDKIDLVRRPAPERKRTHLAYGADSLILDGQADPLMQGKPSVEWPSGQVAWITANNRYISLFLDLPDSDTLGEIVHIDMTLSSNTEAWDRRTRRLMSDHWFSNDIASGKERSESLNYDLTRGGTEIRKRADGTSSVEWHISMDETHYPGVKPESELLFDLKLRFEKDGKITELSWNSPPHKFAESPYSWGFVEVQQRY